MATTTSATMQFDARALSDDELVVLESTLRVQLAVAKHERVQQVTLALGSALLTGGVAALLACPSIVCSTVQRRKCRRRHIECCNELAARNVAIAPIQAVTFAKRALALSIASGLTCCVLGVALDVLVDGAVLQVVSFFFSSYFEDRMALGTTAVLQRRGANLVGCNTNTVQLLDAAPQPHCMLFGDPHAAARAAVPRNEGPVELSRRLWKSASWSFATRSVSATIRDAKRAFQHRLSLREDGRAMDEDDNNVAGAANDWTSLFPSSSASTEARRRTADATLFGCFVLDATASDDALPTARVELVRSEAFALFGDCYVVQVLQADNNNSCSNIDNNCSNNYCNNIDSKWNTNTNEMLFPCGTSNEHCRVDDDDDAVAAGVPMARVVSWSNDDNNDYIDTRDRTELFPSAHDCKSVLFAGDDIACAFWDGIWDDDNDGDNDNDGVCGNNGSTNNNDLDAAFGSEMRDDPVWNTDDDAAWLEACGLLSHNRPRTLPSVCTSALQSATDSDDAGDAYDLFGVSKRLDRDAAEIANPATKPAATHYVHAQPQYNLFG